MRIIGLVNDPPITTGRRILVDWGDGRGAVPEGIPDEIADRDVARVLADKTGRRPRGWRAVDEREIQPRPRTSL